MQNGKKLQIIESIKNMPDKEADILEVFVAGFRAGKLTAMVDLEFKQPYKQPTMQMTQLQKNLTAKKQNNQISIFDLDD